MWIENAELRFTQGELTVATYEEWQRHADGTPNGLVWVHVHETWLQEAV